MKINEKQTKSPLSKVHDNETRLNIGLGSFGSSI